MTIQQWAAIVAETRWREMAGRRCVKRSLCTALMRNGLNLVTSAGAWDANARRGAVS
jgi:hypothetical protein